ncbi:MAG TPA: hypothetical protein VGO03_07585 [Acidimicrobiia bacterium]
MLPKPPLGMCPRCNTQTVVMEIEQISEHEGIAIPRIVSARCSSCGLDPMTEWTEPSEATDEDEDAEFGDGSVADLGAVRRAVEGS